LGRGQGGGESSEGTCFFLRLRGTLDDGATIDNDYAFCVLPKADHAPIPVLFITGGCYEDAVSVQFLKAAGFQIDHRIAGPDRKLDPGKVNLAAYRAVVLGPIFNPLTSLGKEFLARLRPAVEGGLGLAWFGYNTSAYLSGRYPVDELRGSALESLLPVTFPEQYYITSEELKSATGHTCIHAHLKKAAEHPIWSGIDMAPCGPDLGIHMRADARPGATVIGVEGAPELKAAPDSAGTPPATPPADSPVLVAGHLGKGNVVAFTGPYGGQNYQGCDFRQWPWANRLISNIIEFAATGNVQPGAFTPHVFAPLLAMPKCTFDASVRELPSPSGSRAETREWEITVRNTGRVPVLYFNVQNDSDDEGDSFDWHVSENHVMLFEGESKVIYAMAVARPGRKVPEGMNVKWEAWNAE